MGRVYGSERQPGSRWGWNALEDVLGLCRGCAENALGMPQGCSGDALRDALGMCWECAGDALEMQIRLRSSGLGLCPPAPGYLSLPMTSCAAVSVPEQHGLQVAW